MPGDEVRDVVAHDTHAWRLSELLWRDQKKLAGREAERLDPHECGLAVAEDARKGSEPESRGSGRSESLGAVRLERRLRTGVAALFVNQIIILL
jgi:hypothetical protein